MLRVSPDGQYIVTSVRRPWRTSEGRARKETYYEGQKNRSAPARPEDANAEENLGAALFEKGQVGEPIEHGKRAVAINPDPS